MRFLLSKKFLPKKCITIAPGGYLGLYMLGTMIFLKNNYNMKEYYIGGVSAGAFLSLYALSKYNDNVIFNQVVDPLLTDLDGIKWEFLLSNMKTYTSELSGSIDRDRLFLTTTKVKYHYPWFENIIKTEFCSDNEVIDFAIASSFVPLLCGDYCMCNKADMYIDGAFTNTNPIPYNCEQILYVNPGMWGRNFTILDCLNVDKTKAMSLIVMGYIDANKNKKTIPLKQLPILHRMNNKFSLAKILHKRFFLGL